MSPGSELLTALNCLSVTRSGNWATWANCDLPHYWPIIRDMGRLRDSHQGTGAISASGNERGVIQVCGWKRKWHLHFDGVPRGLPILLPRNDVLFWQLFMSYLLVRTIGKFVMTFIDIIEIGCMSIPKCHWMVIAVIFFQTDLNIYMMPYFDPESAYHKTTN